MRTPQDLMRAYEERINRHDFDAMTGLIATDATFYFSDGTYHGIDQIRAAFEATWKALNNDTYALSDVNWIARDDTVAACTYRFRWTSEIDGLPAQGSGRGTTVMERLDGHWRVVHEHLSADSA